jgi:hypothetical protein
VDVLVSDVVDAAIANIGTSPCLETSTVLIKLDQTPRRGEDIAYFTV